MKMKFVLILITVLSLSSLTAGADESETILAQKRTQMVEDQIKARGIKDPRVIQAMLKVKRHLFVPGNYRDQAYADHPLPIGYGQTISQPYIVALMTELLALKGRERVLEIGTGSGYQAAILAELAKEVYTIEIIEPLARRSEGLLKELVYNNIKVKFGDGFLGWPELAPFDGIIVTCAPEKIPEPLLEQLAEDGRLVIPVGTYWQELKLVRKVKGRTTVADIVPVRFVPMLREKRNKP
jgi:protein-L-isoaspartate(D-aspartate) O-methyltransferase